MKKYLILVLLATGLLAGTGAFAQENAAKAEHKEKSMDRKSNKAMAKDENGKEKKGDKKDRKGLRKSSHVEKKENKGKYD